MTKEKDRTKYYKHNKNDMVYINQKRTSLHLLLKLLRYIYKDNVISMETHVNMDNFCPQRRKVWYLKNKVEKIN